MPAAIGSIGIKTSAAGSSSCESPQLRDHWYAYTPACDGEVTVRVDNTMVFNLAVFDGCGGTELDCDLGTFIPVHNAEITWTASAGQTYRIRVSGPPALYVLFVSSVPLTPVNDDAGAAQAMGLGETVRAQFCGATNDGMSACAPTERDVWFSYTSPTPSAISSSSSMHRLPRPLSRSTPRRAIRRSNVRTTPGASPSAPWSSRR
jgi:hypothetical protein